MFELTGLRSNIVPMCDNVVAYLEHHRANRAKTMAVGCKLLKSLQKLFSVKTPSITEIVPTIFWRKVLLVFPHFLYIVIQCFHQV